MRGPADPFSLPDLASPVPVHPADVLLTPERARKYRQVLARRCQRLVIVVEDCTDPHNATAIVRTCDAFGLSRVFVTTAKESFKINPKISQGSHYYVDVVVHRDITSAYAQLRAEGYRILVTDLAADAVIGPDALKPLLAEQPLALVFGNETAGVSAAASAQADGCFLIPMSGFPQSLNLSVSVAATVYALRGEALSTNSPGDLSAEQQVSLYDLWLRRHKGDLVDRVLTHDVDRKGTPVEVFRAENAPA
jgi:tRNA (guanosine-2'-O-)-methyltransferase